MTEKNLSMFALDMPQSKRVWLVSDPVRISLIQSSSMDFLSNSRRAFSTSRMRGKRRCFFDFTLVTNVPWVKKAGTVSPGVSPGSLGGPPIETFVLLKSSNLGGNPAGLIRFLDALSISSSESLERATGNSGGTVLLLSLLRRRIAGPTLSSRSFGAAMERRRINLDFSLGSESDTGRGQPSIF